MRHPLIITILFGIFSLGVCFTLQAQDRKTVADDMDEYVEAFKKVEHLAEAHCKQALGDFDECMDKQFNCFIEGDQMFNISDKATKRAKREAITYDREGNRKAIDFCEAKRKAKIYNAQEKAREMEEKLE